VNIYKYGTLAWVWRGFIAMGVILAAIFLAASVASWSLWPFVGAVALAAPSLFFGLVVVVRADLIDGQTVLIRTLVFYPRRIALDRLGPSRIRRTYVSDSVEFDAPRVWVPVKGGLPLYFDLLGQIPDRQAFLKAIGQTGTKWPRR